MNADNWIADGTSNAEPVTTVTPADETQGLDNSAPMGATEASVAPATEDQVQAAVDAGAETAAEVQAYIEGRLGDQPYKIPEAAMFPLKRGDSVEYVPATELLKRGMMERDYRIKTDEHSRAVRAFEARQTRFQADQAKIEARARYLEEKEQEIRAALTDPKGARAYEDHLHQYQTNPMYRKNVDAALAQRETEAELDTLRGAQQEQLKEEALGYVRSWVDELRAQYPGVDPERATKTYGSMLSNGQANLDRSHLEYVFKTEAAYLERAASPLRETLAELTAKVEAMQAKAAADRQNETTQHAVNRARTPKVATGSGAPAKTGTQPTKFGPNELHERNDAWARGG